MINDDLHVVHACAAGLDIHKMQITPQCGVVWHKAGSRCVKPVRSRHFQVD